MDAKIGNIDSFLVNYIEAWPIIVGPDWRFPPKPPHDTPRAKKMYEEWCAASADLYNKYKEHGQAPYVTYLRDYREKKRKRERKLRERRNIRNNLP